MPDAEAKEDTLSALVTLASAVAPEEMPDVPPPLDPVPVRRKSFCRPTSADGVRNNAPHENGSVS